MPTTNLYTKAQGVLHPFRNLFLGGMLLLVAVVFFVISGFEPGPVPPEKEIWTKVFILAICAAGILGWFHSVSTYQKESKFRQIPYVGKVIKIVFGTFTPRSEAIQLNLIFLCLLLLNIVGGFMVRSV